jgi:hypothetical protein
MDSNKKVVTLNQGTRAAYEATLARAAKHVMFAQSFAEELGCFGEMDDLLQMQLMLRQMLEDCLKHPARRALPGQLELKED